MLRLFAHIVRLSFQQQITYRTAILAGLATNFFFALLRAAVLTGLYAGQTEVNGLTLNGAITYVAISQSMIVFLFIFGSWEVMTTVYTGSIGSDLLRPVSLFAFWMARDLGRSLVNFVGRGLLLIAMMGVFFPLEVPHSLQQWLMLPLVLMFGWGLSFSWRFLVNLTAFWTPDARGFGRIAFAISGLLSGFFMPLRLYPDWFVQFCNFTPFPALFNTTVEVYLGLITGEQIWYALAVQVVWFAVLSLAGHFVLRAGVRRLVIQGG